MLEQDYSGDMRILVADDGSTDRTAELARRRAAEDPRIAVAALTPAPLIATVKLRKTHHVGRYGLQAVAKIPPIADGSGSLLDFSLEVKRLFTYKDTQESYAMARCPDGHLNAEISTLFKNEAKVPGVASQTLMMGTVTRRCTPKGSRPIAPLQATRWAVSPTLGGFPDPSYSTGASSASQSPWLTNFVSFVPRFSARSA